MQHATPKPVRIRPARQVDDDGLAPVYRIVRRIYARLEDERQALDDDQLDERVDAQPERNSP